MTSRGDPATGTRTEPPTTEPQRPSHHLTDLQATASSTISTSQSGAKKRRNHRAGKKAKGRRKQSFHPDDVTSAPQDRPGESSAATASQAQFYRRNSNLSDGSLDSEALLDHREQQPLRPRRDSRPFPSPFARWSNHDLSGQQRSNRPPSYDSRQHRRQSIQGHSAIHDASDDDARPSDRTPLLAASHPSSSSPGNRNGFGTQNRQARVGRRGSHHHHSAESSRSSARRRQNPHFPGLQPISDVNNPPSVPNSPKLGADIGYDDFLVADHARPGHFHDQVIDIDGGGARGAHGSAPPTPPQLSPDQRRHTIQLSAEKDVCFPIEQMSAIGEEDDLAPGQNGHAQGEPRKKRYRRWPDLSVLEEWSIEEKEERSEGIRAKKISEPVLVGGRLRPQQRTWHRAEEDAPYRFTYFNEDFPSTIHSQTISELLQPGQGFAELFIPEPPVLSDDDDYSSDEEDDIRSRHSTTNNRPLSPVGSSRAVTRHSSLIGELNPFPPTRSGAATPTPPAAPELKEPTKRYGDRPTFWLDVLSPTDTEMKVISKAFGIHPLTAEDIMMQEAREKVELFPKYYFVNYRTFEQDMNSEDYLEPVNMYVVVFPEGIISFHFSMSPHPANVRRRIRQLKEYLQASSDWISYALIDDITDVFAPLIQNIEEEVDEIDDAILKLLYDKKEDSIVDKFKPQRDHDSSSEASANIGNGDMLRRIGEARKRVMMLYRLLGNKADVIKGFAKRCNERWRIAPKSDIGLYLGDIQDHILTMTGNLSHYETLLSRAHSNFLAQMNMRMNERQEQTADVLGKLTVLGTIVLPMNIITGMWGMNVLVPGQDVDNLYWFWSITAGLLVFGISCFFIAKRVYGIV